MSTKEITDGFKGITALVVGDVMLDAYLWGRVDRVSPEAPVPVVQVVRRSARLGGAANVALNLHALGAKAIIASVTGEDAYADDLARLIGEEGLTSDGLQLSRERRTTVKTRIISDEQHVVRVDEETLGDLSKEEEQRFLHHTIALIRKEKPDVLIFEDYDKGVLAPGVIAGLIAEAQRSGIPVAVDPKREHFFDYREVDLFKPNMKELREGLKVDIPAGDLKAVSAAVRMLEARLANKASLITLSEHGVFAHTQGEETLLPAHKRNIIDVSGAGDTVIAVAGLCLALGLPLAEIAAWANLAGGLVCEQVGVVPVDLARLCAEAERLGLGAPASQPAMTVKPYTAEGSKREQVEQMFDRISPKYDLLNRVCSLGTDQGWRRKVIRSVGKEPVERLLDVATGTADLAIMGSKVARYVTGADISAGMLAHGRSKVEKAGLSDRIELVQADAAELPYPDASFDAVTVAFGVRNFEDLKQGLAGMARVLRPGGRLFVLEFSRPQRTPFKQLFRFYFHRVMPLIGRLVSKDNDAYTYLPESVDAFPQGKDFEEVLLACGLQPLKSRPLTFGVATLYSARK